MTSPQSSILSRMPEDINNKILDFVGKKTFIPLTIEFTSGKYVISKDNLGYKIQKYNFRDNTKIDEVYYVPCSIYVSDIVMMDFWNHFELYEEDGVMENEYFIKFYYNQLLNIQKILDFELINHYIELNDVNENREERERTHTMIRDIINLKKTKFRLNVEKTFRQMLNLLGVIYKKD